MKTEEDEAFDDLAKKQGDWGGGFKAKRAMAADKLQEPIYKITVIDNAHPKGIPFEDWVQPTQDVDYWIREATAARQAELALRRELEALAQPAQDGKCKLCVDGCAACDARAQPAQREWVGLTDEEIRDCLGPEAVCIPPGWSRLTRAIEAKLKEKNND